MVIITIIIIIIIVIIVILVMLFRVEWALLHWFLPCSAALWLLLRFQTRWTVVAMMMMVVAMMMMTMVMMMMVMVVKMKVNVKVKVYEQIDTEGEDRGLIALSILVGKLQVLIFSSNTPIIIIASGRFEQCPRHFYHPPA